MPFLGKPEPTCSPIGVMAISAPKLNRAIPRTSSAAHATNTHDSWKEKSTSGVRSNSNTISVTGRTEIAASFSFVNRAFNMEHLFVDFLR